jgi:metal-responsive CopG/Arc/MetJ family transcriptional regulator
LIAIRLSDDGIAHIDKLAEERGVNRSEMIRIMLAFATQKMPKTFNP